MTFLRRRREVCDLAAIRVALVDYCRAVDRADRSLLQSVYHPDSVDRHGRFTGNGADFADYLASSVQDHGHEALAHHITNVRVAFDGDVAVSESYFLALHRLASEVHVLSGRYLDRWARRSGVWLIVERTVVRDIDCALERKEAFPPGYFPADGRMDESDISYTMGGLAR